MVRIDFSTTEVPNRDHRRKHRHQDSTWNTNFSKNRLQSLSVPSRFLPIGFCNHSSRDLPVLYGVLSRWYLWLVRLLSDDCWLNSIKHPRPQCLHNREVTVLFTHLPIWYFVAGILLFSLLPVEIIVVPTTLARAIKKSGLHIGGTSLVV